MYLLQIFYKYVNMKQNTFISYIFPLSIKSYIDLLQKKKTSLILQETIKWLRSACPQNIGIAVNMNALLHMQ